MMSPILIVSVIAIYFGILFFIAYLTSRKADTDSFFSGNRESAWYLVAFGMIGTSLSGVTFISVPGAVGKMSFSYFQIVIGYLIGYFIIQYLLMPIYYKLELVSIYTYLEKRLGKYSYKIGAFFFLLSRTIGSSLRLYLAASVLQIFLFDRFQVPFAVTVGITLLLIWSYTFKGGVKTIVWTDSFQTIFLISSVCICVGIITQKMNLGFTEMISTVWQSPKSQIFFLNVNDDKFFLKQIVAGIFLAVCMTGLDQDLMQKNLTCKSLPEARKNMLWFSLIYTFVNFIFLWLGALLYLYSESKGLALPAKSDDLFPMLALNEFGILAGIFFLLGIIASSYASSDSALTALTTSFCIDFLDVQNKKEEERKRLKTYTHVGFSLLFFVIILIFREFSDQSLIGTVLKMASYTYGPLLGLFAFGIFTSRQVKDKLVPLICIISPFLCWTLVNTTPFWLGGYKFGFEILIFNGALTFAGLLIISKKKV